MYKMTTPKISVIMSVYNGGKYLREAIESILNQTFTEFEFIIVNDGSTDNSREIIQSYNDERIKIINNEENIGLPKSLNNALKAARGEYIARQDADDISLPNRFEEQIKYFEKHPEVMLLGTNAYIINESGKTIRKYICPSNPAESLFKLNQLVHGSVMFKKEIIEKVGLYNELLRYVQDYEFWARATKHYEVRSLNSVLYKKRFFMRIASFKKVKEHALCSILAKKLVRNEVDERLLTKIERGDINSLYPFLNLPEKVRFFKYLISYYICRNNPKLALGWYVGLFKK